MSERCMLLLSIHGLGQIFLCDIYSGVFKLRRVAHPLLNRPLSVGFTYVHGKGHILIFPSNYVNATLQND